MIALLHHLKFRVTSQDIFGQNSFEFDTGTDLDNGLRERSTLVQVDMRQKNLDTRNHRY